MNNDALYNFTSLARPIDPAYPTNRAILILVLFSGVISGMITLVRGNGWVDTTFSGFYTAIVVLLIWIVTREIDPDFGLSAFVSAVLGFGVSLFIEPTSLLGVIFAIPLTRLVNRTVGIKLKRIDTLIVIGLTCIMILLNYWFFGFVAALAFLLDARLHNPNTHHYGAALVSFVATTFYLLVNSAGEFAAISTAYLVVVVGISAAYFFVLMMTKEIREIADTTDEILNLYRVLWGMAIALVLGVVMLWRGDGGIIEMAPLWVSMLGVVIYRVGAPLLGITSTPENLKLFKNGHRGNHKSVYF